MAQRCLDSQCSYVFLRTLTTALAAFAALATNATTVTTHTTVLSILPAPATNRASSAAYATLTATAPRPWLWHYRGRWQSPQCGWFLFIPGCQQRTPVV